MLVRLRAYWSWVPYQSSRQEAKATTIDKPKEVKKTNKPQPQITDIDSDGLDSETDVGAPLQVNRNYRIWMTKTSANLLEYEHNG